MSRWTASLIKSGLEALRDKPTKKSTVTTLFSSIAGYPFKVLASFFVAPFLILFIAVRIESPIRRWIARIGLAVAILAAYAAGTFLGTLTAAALIATKIGLIWGLAFLVGTYLSLVLSVVFSILVLNSVALFFLHMSQQEVIDYVKGLAE